MNFATLPIFTVMKSKLGYLSAQEAQLAQNISNADTPDYRAKDVIAPDFKKMAFGASGAAQNLQPVATDSKHISIGGGGSGFTSAVRASTFERNPNGNNVSIEEEIAKAAETAQEYTKVLNLYRKTVDMFKTAIGKQNG